MSRTSAKTRKTINISKIAVVLTRQWFHPTALNPFITGTWGLGFVGGEQVVWVALVAK